MATDEAPQTVEPPNATASAGAATPAVTVDAPAVDPGAAANLSARGGLRRRRRPRARRNLHRERGGAGAEVDPSRLAPGELIETVLQGDADVPPRHLRRSPKVKASDEHAFAEFSRRLPGVNLRRGTEKPGFIRTGSRWEERGSGRVEDENRMHERAARGEGDQKTRDRGERLPAGAGASSSARAVSRTSKASGSAGV